MGNIYDKYRKLIRNKDFAVNHILRNTLTKTQSMFNYYNLPETCPACELENILQTRGKAFVTEFQGKIYAFDFGFGGAVNVYNKPTKAIVCNVALQLNKEYDLEKDGIYFKNDYFDNGLMEIIGKYAVLQTDTELTLNTAAILSRITMLISASDDKTKQSADLFLQNIEKGNFSVIAENAFLKGVNLQNITTQNSQIIQLIELLQYYKAQMLNEIGLNANFNMKRERLNETELLMNNDNILPFVENMFNCRLDAIKKLNAKYNLNVEIELNSAWKTEHENNEKINENIDTISKKDIIFATENITENTNNENTNNENADTNTINK